MNIDLINVVTEDAVRLDGAWRRPERSGQSRIGVDLVIQHHGVTGNFYGRSFFDPIGDALLAEGCAVMRVNNRGHDLIYNFQSADGFSRIELEALRAKRGRLGSSFEIIDDCRHDWKAWLDFAEANGYNQVAIWGHSLGAVKSIYHAAKVADPRVRCVVASSPPRFSYERNTSVETGAEFVANVERARQLVSSGQPDAIMSVTVPNANLFAAKTFLDKYGPEDQYDIFKHMPNVRVRLLVTLGSKETTTPFSDLRAKGSELEGQIPNMSYLLVEGADHEYAGRTDELWQSARAWLASVTTPAAPVS